MTRTPRPFSLPRTTARNLSAVAATFALAVTLLASPAGAQGTPEPPLERGDAGDSIESLQTLLNDYLALSSSDASLIREDGIFGRDTEAAVEAFETATGLPVDGIVTRSDRQQLIAIVESLEESTASSTVRQGDTGATVESWQISLNDLYRLSNSSSALIVEDGVFGSDTTLATRNFEKLADLQVDGVVEPEDRSAMRETLDDLRGSGDMPPLVTGDSGKVVENAQDLLNDYLALSASSSPLIREDGIFGPSTTAAAVEFETATGRTVDGVLTRAELVALRRAVEALESSLPESVVQQGSTGRLVEVWQIALNDWIFYSKAGPGLITEDGVFGANSTAATRAFETSAGLQVDGIVEPIDRATMRSTLEDLRNQPPAAGTMAAAETLGQFITATDYKPDLHGPILRLYPAFFDRQADVEGAQYWVIDVHLREQQTVKQITQFFASPAQPEFVKFYSDIAPGDHRAYLTRVYQNMLTRTPDQAGLEYWLGKMNEGTLDRGGVVRFVALNPEFVALYPYGS